MFKRASLVLASLHLIVGTEFRSPLSTMKSRIFGMDSSIRNHLIDFAEKDSTDALKSRPLNHSGFNFIFFDKNASDGFEASTEKLTGETADNANTADTAVTTNITESFGNEKLHFLSWIFLWGFLVLKLGWHGQSIWVGGTISTLTVLSDATGWTLAVSMALAALLQLVFNQVKDFGTENVISIVSEVVHHNDVDEKKFSVEFRRMFWAVTVASTIGVLILSSISSPAFKSPFYTIILVILLYLFGWIIGILHAAVWFLVTENTEIMLMSSIAGVFLYFVIEVAEFFSGRQHSITIVSVSKEEALIFVTSSKRCVGQKTVWQICINVPVSVFEGFSIGIRPYNTPLNPEITLLSS